LIADKAAGDGRNQRNHESLDLGLGLQNSVDVDGVGNGRAVTVEQRREGERNADD